MSFAVAPAVVGCVLFQTFQQVAFSLSGRLPEKKRRWLLIGVACYLSELFFWFQMLKMLPLGIAVPLLSANYITVSLAGYFLFKEHLDFRYWIGISCIILGIILIAQGM